MRTHPVDVYDYIYSWKDYAEEAKTLRRFLNQYGDGEISNILEVACGTGRYLEHFQDIDCYGVDLCERSLQYAQSRVPKGSFFCQDMQTISLPDKMDAVLCVFGAIGYLHPITERLTFLIRLADHLKKGGILLIEPWVSVENFQEGIPFVQTYISPNFKVARTVVPERKGSRCILSFSFLLARSGWKVEAFDSVDELWLHSNEDLEIDLRTAGFKILDKKQGFLDKSPIYVCEKL